MNFSEYINIPYKNLGRSKEGCDCFGIIWLVFKEKRNIILPDFTDLKYTNEWYRQHENHILENLWDVWGVVNEPYKVYDGIIFYHEKMKVANHIGMIIDDGKFIHVSQKFPSRVDKLNPYWRSRIYKVMRYKDA